MHVCVRARARVVFTITSFILRERECRDEA